MEQYFVTSLLTLSSHSDHLGVISKLIEDEVETGLANNPNVTVLNSEAASLKIKQVRTIIEELAYASFQGKKRWYILLHADLATLPAQNAMLKILEEPPVNTQIILTCSSSSMMLPTILSRCQIISEQEIVGEGEDLSEESRGAAAQLLQQLGSANYASAIELAAAFKDRAAALTLVNNLLLLVTENLNHNTGRENIELGKNLLDARLALQQNLNPTLVLENLFFQSIKQAESKVS